MHLPDRIENARLSVVQIASGADPGTRNTLGTGFIVGSGRFVVTAKHVVDAACDQLLVGLPGVDHDSDAGSFRAAFVWIPAKLLGTDELNDLALLEVGLPPGGIAIEINIQDTDGREYTAGKTRPMSLATSRPRPGLEIAVSGFPLRSPALVTTRGILANTFTSADPTDPGARVSYLCDVTIINGNSGGPVYGVVDGRVIGVCVALPNVPAGIVPLAIVTPIRHVRDLMTRLGVAVDPPTQESERARGSGKRRKNSRRR